VGFLSPWFLVGLLAVGLPIWLHLLRQYKNTPLKFSSLMFFERRLQSSTKHRRLRYLLLLAMRLALLALLALAFASPFINRTETVAGKRKLVLIAVDRSFSMRSGNRLELAKREAGHLIDSLGGQTLTQGLAVDSHVETLTTPGPVGSGLKEAIQAIQPTDQASSFGEFMRTLRAMEQTSGMHLDVHFISDMQETSMPSDFRSLQAGKFITFTPHRIGELKRANWAVESVSTNALLEGNEQARVTATAAAWNAPATKRRLSLVLDNKVLATKEVDLSENGRSTIEFADIQVPYGTHRGEVRMEPADELPQDDSFAFSVERQDPRRVLFLYSNARATRGTLYYKTALEAGTHGSITAETASLANLGDRDFSRYAFVVLSDVGEMDSAVADALCSYVQKGGAVLIALGPMSARSGVIPLSKEHFSEQQQQQGSGYIDSGHPTLATGREFENVQFSRTAFFVPKPDARVLAKFADGSALLTEERAGNGKKLILSSTFDGSDNDFALHASFVTFVAQTARYLAGTEEAQTSLVAGTPILLRQKTSSGTANVVGPDGKQELELADAQKALSFDVMRSGFYEIRRADGKRMLAAVHADRRESNLQGISDEALNLWRNTGDTKPGADYSKQQTQTQPWSFWRYILALALLAALVESLFADKYLAGKGVKGETETA
jgi:hypothetical protein